MTTALAIVSNDVGRTPAELPDLAAAQETISALVAQAEAGLLDEARCRAEAYALYEKRRGHRERELHFAKLRLLAEAGLGALAYDSPDLVEDKYERGDFRALAAGFERGVLVEVADTCVSGRGGLSTSSVAQALRNRGWTWVPGRALGTDGSVAWTSARALARTRGVDPKSLPNDGRRAANNDRFRLEQSKRMHRLYEAQRRLERMKQSKAIASAAKDKSRNLDVAYNHLRKGLQALHDAQLDLTPTERDDLDMVFSHLYYAEDYIGSILGLRSIR